MRQMRTWEEQRPAKLPHGHRANSSERPGHHRVVGVNFACCSCGTVCPPPCLLSLCSHLHSATTLGLCHSQPPALAQSTSPTNCASNNSLPTREGGARCPYYTPNGDKKAQEPR
jgi:hypothetical protein